MWAWCGDGVLKIWADPALSPLFSVLWSCEGCQDYLCIGASHGRHWQTIARRPATEIIPCVFLYLLDWSDPANWFKISNKGPGNVSNTTLNTGQSSHGQNNALTYWELTIVPMVMCSVIPLTNFYPAQIRSWQQCHIIYNILNLMTTSDC